MATSIIPIGGGKGEGDLTGCFPFVLLIVISCPILWIWEIIDPIFGLSTFALVLSGLFMLSFIIVAVVGDREFKSKFMKKAVDVFLILWVVIILTTAIYFSIWFAYQGY